MKIELDHLALNVEDVNASAQFYREIFFAEIERMDKYEKGYVPFPSIRLNEDTVIDLFPPQMWKQDNGDRVSGINNLSHFCIALSEVEWRGLVDRLKLNNVEITRYSDDNWGAKGLGISVYFLDPDGNEVEARYYRKD